MRKILNNDGSILVMMIIIIAITISLGLLSMNIAMSQYQIKRSNTEIKKSLYLSEDGLNRTYMRTYDLISDACDDSLNKADEYLLLNPEKLAEASSLFQNNYKLYVLNETVNRIQISTNPSIEVLESNKLLFMNEKLTIKIKSRYLSEKGIEKATKVNFIVSVPEYMDVKSGTFNYSDILGIDGYDY